jgi:hypothetical protein
MKRARLLGLSTIVLALGMIAAGCDNGTTSSSDESGSRTLTITGLNGKSGSFALIIGSSIAANNSGSVAGGQAMISSNSVVIPLKQISGGSITQADWTGTGEYLMYGTIGAEAVAYFYTGGKTMAQLGINNNSTDVVSKLPKYNFSGGSVTLSFDQFAALSN